MGTTKTRPVTRRNRPPGILEEAYLHLTSAKHSTSSLARVLRVSVPTAFRIINQLRRRGTRVESVKRGRHWYFEVIEDKALDLDWHSDPLLSAIGFIKGKHRTPGQSEDDVLYGLE